MESRAAFASASLFCVKRCKVNRLGAIPARKFGTSLIASRVSPQTSASDELANFGSPPRRKLQVSERTVKTLVHDVQLTLGTTTRAQAVAEGVRLSLI